MSHEVEMLTYPDNAPISRIEGLARCRFHEMSRNEENDYNGASFGKMHVITKVFDTYEDAENYLNDKWCGEYQFVAVRYHRVRSVPMSDATKTAVETRDELRQKHADASSVDYVARLTSKRVTCQKCRTNFDREYLVRACERSNKCPMCGSDLRPKTARESVKSLRDAYDGAQARVDECVRDDRARASHDAPLYWLVKAEWHARKP